MFGIMLDMTKFLLRAIPALVPYMSLWTSHDVWLNILYVQVIYNTTVPS